MKRFIILFFSLIVNGCNEPENIFILNEIKSGAELKLIFNKEFVSPVNSKVLLPIFYENDYKDPERSRVKVSENTKYITIKPDEKIRIGCVSGYHIEPKCSYRSIKDNHLEFVEITHLGLKKKVRFNVEKFYGLRSLVWPDTVYIKESMFK